MSQRSLLVAYTAALLASCCTQAAFVPQSHRATFAPTTTRTTSSTALGASSGLLNCRPIGIGSATPSTIITNVDLEKVVETSDEWIRSRTGIAQRRVLKSDEKVRDLSIAASKQALEMAGVTPQELDIIICACSSPDDLFGDAPVIAQQLGCGTHTVAFDLTAACSGFLFAAVTAGKFLSANTAKKQKALVIGADALSRWIDWDDRNVCILFGDGAGAMVMEATSADEPSTSGLLGYAARSNGAGNYELYSCIAPQPRTIKTPGEGVIVGSGNYQPLYMNGKEVYKFATREVPEILLEALKAADMTVADVDWLLLHQANIRIMEVVAKRLGVPMDKVLTNLDKYGNTSAASIPLALDEFVRSGKVKKGDVIACSGFGAGLSWGAAIFRWG